MKHRIDEYAVDVRGPWPIVIYDRKRTYTLATGRFDNRFAEVDVAHAERVLTLGIKDERKQQ